MISPAGAPTFQRFTEAKRETLAAFERDYFTRLHDAALGNISEMARLAGMERTHLREYLDRHGIGGRSPVERRQYRVPKALAELAQILAPREGESLTEAASRVVAAAERRRR